MSLKTRGILVLVIGTILGVSLSLGGGVLAERKKTPPATLSWDQARLLAEVMQRVKQEYVEPLDNDALLEKAIRGMVGDLDHHSAFLDADEYQDIRVTASGRYTGVGLEVSVEDGQLLVIAPIDGTPAQKAGILAGDEIRKINDQLVIEKDLDEAIDRLRGTPGSTVTLEVRRPGYDDPLSFRLTRRAIEVASTRHELLDGNIGYLRLSQFIDSTAADAAHAIEAMTAENGQPLTGLILDLRNNPGGVLDAAVDVSDLFLDTGLIVSAVGRTPESQFSRDATRGDILDGAEMAVLVNGGSASASEIVAGALQDHDRATIIGTRTFGKGLVQTVVPLSHGRAVKLTTSRYFTPSGDSIDQIGVSPDVYVESTAGLRNINLSGSVDRESDMQLSEALQILERRPVMHSRAAVPEL